MTDRYDEVRDEIAKDLMARDYKDGTVWCNWECRDLQAEKTRTYYRNTIDKVLLSNKGIAILDADQSLPLVSYEVASSGIIYGIYIEAQKDMLKAGWRKIVL